MISSFLVILLVGACAGLQMKPVRPDRHLQKDVPMAAVPRHNSVNVPKMVPQHNSVNVPKMMPQHNSMNVPKMMPQHNSVNVLRKKMMPRQNLADMPKNMSMPTMATMPPSGNSTNMSGNMTMVTPFPTLNLTTTQSGNVTYPSWNVTTTSSYNVTYPPWNITTPAPGNRSCGGIIFVEQMTRDITTMRKQNFFNITKTLASMLHTQGKWNSYSYAYTQYGSMVYRGMNVTDYFDFMRDVNQAEYNFTASNLPNGGYTYLAPMLTQILNFFEYSYGQRFAVLLMGEDSVIRDPTNAYSVAQSIAAYNANIYVLDYSQGAIPISIWPTLTNNKPFHIVNGAELTMEEIVNQLDDTLLSDVLDGNC